MIAQTRNCAWAPPALRFFASRGRPMDHGLKFRVGAVEISRVPEFQAPMFEPDFLYPTLPPELLVRHRSWLEPVHLDPASGRLVISIHAFVLRTARATILVDACAGNGKNRPGR